MQFPVGMEFNPDTARNEMVNFWEIIFSPMAVHKFLHTVSSGLILSAIFVTGISAWFLLKNRQVEFAKRSILVASVFGIIASFFVVFTGDNSARTIAHHQPVKFAAFEGLTEGTEKAGLVAFGIIDPKENKKDYQDFVVKMELPRLLSFMAFGNFDAYVPGMRDLVEGNEARGIMPVTEKIDRGREARRTLRTLKNAKKAGNENEYNQLIKKFQSKEFQEGYFKYFGYGFLNDPKSVLPNVPLTFYSFHIMVVLGFYFVLLMMLLLYFTFKGGVQKRKWLLYLALWSIPLPYIAGQAGWITAEVGRQPWAIQDIMPTMAAVTNIDATSVQITFWMFVVLMTGLLIAEIAIMTKQIKIGPKEGGE
jgi:cytochrome d ubiquinol oxidase subunit I